MCIRDRLSNLDVSANFTNHSYQTNTLGIGAKYSMGSAWVGAGTVMTLSDDEQPADVSDADWEEMSGTLWGMSVGAGVVVPVGDYDMHISYAMRSANEYFDDHSVIQVSLDF